MRKRPPLKRSWKNKNICRIHSLVIPRK